MSENNIYKIKLELINRNTPAPWQRCKGGSIDSLNESNLRKIIYNENTSYIGKKKSEFIISKILQKKRELAGKVIEIGSGAGINLYAFFRYGIDNLLGIDFDSDAVEFSRNLSDVMGYNICFQQGNIIELHNIVGAEEASIIIVDSVLEHIIEYDFAISSIMKTLKTGGLALIIVPSLFGGYSLLHDIDYKNFTWKGQKNNYDPADHVNHFWFNEIANAFKSYGGQVREYHKFQAYRAFFTPLTKFKAFSFMEILDYYLAQILPLDMATRTIVIEKISKY